MAKFAKKYDIVEAFIWAKHDGSHPEVKQRGPGVNLDCLNCGRPTELHGFVSDGINDGIPVCRGNWIVGQIGTESCRVLSEEAFTAEYEPIDKSIGPMAKHDRQANLQLVELLERSLKRVKASL